MQDPNPCLTVRSRYEDHVEGEIFIRHLYLVYGIPWAFGFELLEREAPWSTSLAITPIVLDSQWLCEPGTVTSMAGVAAFSHIG